MIKNMEPLYRLSAQTLHALAASLRDGPLSLGISSNVVRHLVGAGSDIVSDCLNELVKKEGLTPKQIALIIEAIAGTLERSFDPAILFELVLSGPDVPGVPTEDTAAAFQMLVQEAQQEILLVGYAVYGGDIMFEPLAKRMRINPGLKVTFCLDIARKMGDTSLDSEIIRRFAHEFRERQWPWPELPELYYDPRALSPSGEGRASLHAKCVVVDRRAALITSANFTEAAQHRNIELGLLVRYPPIAQRIVDYFLGLRTVGLLFKQPFG